MKKKTKQTGGIFRRQIRLIYKQSTKFIRQSDVWYIDIDNLPAIACLNNVNIQLVLISKTRSFIKVGESPGKSKRDKDPTQFLEQKCWS